MRLETPTYQRFLRFRYNAYRGLGWVPSGLLMFLWVFENGAYNFNAYMLNPPPSGVPKRQEGEDIID